MMDISNLASLLRENGDKVLNAISKLSLTVHLLKKLNEAFTLIVEPNNEGLNTTFQVINTSNSQVEILRDLQFLHDFVQKTIAIKLTHCTLISGEQLTDSVDISKFHSVRLLELCKVPVNLVVGIQGICAQLESVACIRSLSRLEEVLLGCGADRSPGLWNELLEGYFSYNGIEVLDRSLACAPLLQILDLSHNRISQAEAIDCLPNLKYLNMSYNLLEAVPTLNWAARSTLQTLVLNNNCIEDISGLTDLDNLNKLDMSCNCLVNHDGLVQLGKLPSLAWLSLDGNPLSFHCQHRNLTCHHLHSNVAIKEFLLDKSILNKAEKLLVGSCRPDNCPSRSQGDVASVCSSNVSDRTIVHDTEGAARMSSSKKIGRVRKAVISEHDTSVEKSHLSSSVVTSSLELSTQHLETKKQIETLRETFGEEHWLHSRGGSCLQDVLGLARNHSPSSTPLLGPDPIMELILSGTTTTTVYESLLEKTMVAPNPPTTPVETVVESTQEDGGFFACRIPDTLAGDEEDEDGQQDLYFVQRKRSNSPELQGLILGITNRHVKEVDQLTAKTLERWTLDSLLSCVQMSSRPLTLQLSFDTLRKERQERLYVVEDEDSRKLVRDLGKMLESRSLAAMNQTVHRCMKCSAQFSQELQYLTVPDSGLTGLVCPACGSSLIIEMDEDPLPSKQKDLRGDEPGLTAIDKTPLESSIGLNAADGNKLQVTAMVHHPSVVGSTWPHTLRSAESLTPSLETGDTEGESLVKRYDSDIEIISNPSQSSIEVLLEEQGRLPGGTPARKHSEERQNFPRADTAGHLLSLTGLTESSSSGSLTDSICTAYEKPSATKVKLQPRSRSGTAPVKLKSAEDETPAFLSIAGNTYSSMLQGLLQDMGSRHSTADMPHSTDASPKVKYSYMDFSLVDHRVKLHLYLHVFEGEGEELVALLRAEVLVRGPTCPTPGCLVLSTKTMYLLKVTQPERDNPEQWLYKTHSVQLPSVLSVFPLPWSQGLAVDVQDGAPVSSFVVLLQDVQRTNNFLAFLKASGILAVGEPCDAQELLIRGLLQSADEEMDPCLRLFTIFSDCQVTRNTGVKNLSMGALLVTASHLVVTLDDLGWLLPRSSQTPAQFGTQRMSNLIEVEVDGKDLTLHFLDEATCSEEVWRLRMETRGSFGAVMAAIQAPWEELFSVPLQVTPSVAGLHSTK